jgi:hypothetical protein
MRSLQELSSAKTLQRSRSDDAERALRTGARSRACQYGRPTPRKPHRFSHAELHFTCTDNDVELNPR